MEKVRLGDIYSISSGGTPSRKNLEYYSGGTINWVKTGDLKKKYIEETEEKITDKGLYKILTFHGIDTLYISKKLDIKLLKENNYSNKRGFIGGCISKIGNKIIVFGDLNKIDENEEIRKFINKKQKEIIKKPNQENILNSIF